jgi:MFS family permease
MSAAGTTRGDLGGTAAAGAGQQMLFWGCFIALVTTAFGFITRMFLANTFATEFKLDQAQTGELLGIGIWPFAASIIFFSLVIDKIGYKVSMLIAFAGHLIWAVMGYMAYSATRNGDIKTGYNLVYWGSLILALANGTVEAFINPVVATIFSREKTKWLNILHAGWPGGLVIAGIITIFMGSIPWGYKLGIIAVPAVVYFIMLIGQRFPVQERVASGVSYRDMLAEFGTLGAVIVGFLVTLQLIQFFADDVQRTPALRWVFIGIGLAMVVGFGLYTRASGRMLMFVLTLIMIPLATTEIGTDGWITGIMEGVFEMKPEEVAAAGGMGNVLVINGKPYSMHPGWVLVYTSVIMMVLRFFAGPIVHTLSPLGLLAVSAALAIGGLYFLSFTAGVMIFAAATIYALGKTFFWPTMLGVVSEPTPRGGALTLNAISGIGMLAVGVLGFPYIGALQADKEIDAVAASNAAKQVPGLVQDGKLTTVTDKSIYDIIKYKTVDDASLTARTVALPSEQKKEIAEARQQSNQKALANMAIFPCIMLAGYIALILYFRSRGGYRQVHLDDPTNASQSLRSDKGIAGAKAADEY